MGQSNSLQTKTKGKLEQFKLPSPVPSGTLRRRQWKLGTIRKKLVKTFHTTKCPSYRKYIRELIQSWDIQDISSLIAKYDYLDATKEVLIQASRARPSAPSLEKDLLELYEQQYCSDVILIYKDTHFPVHRALLACRCPFLARKLQRNSQINEPLVVDDDLSFMEPLDSNKIILILKFLYTGDMNNFANHEMEEIHANLLSRGFSAINSLEIDIRGLLENCNMTDVTLVFQSQASGKAGIINEDDLEGDVNLEFNCHASILCARSKYFRSLLTRVWQAREPYRKNSRQLILRPLKIPIDESVIPRQYAQVILHCMYTDCVDLHAVIKWRSSEESASGPSETDRLLTTTEIAMELYEIGQFIEFPMLCQGCENVIVEDLSVQTVISALEWSSQPHGSSWVHRQTMLYVGDEFLNLLKSNTLLTNLPKKYLIELLKSDYLEASEEDVLSFVLRWGELQVTRTNSKERQGGSLTNSLTKRSPKRREISNAALNDAVRDCLQYIRTNHIVPVSSVVMQYAYRRGLFQRPMPLDITECDQSAGASAGSALVKMRALKDSWLNGQPRLFHPFYEEVKAVLFERMLSDMNIAQLRSASTKSMPDMLTGARSSGDIDHSQLPSIFTQHVFASDASSIEPETLRRMKSREMELRNLNVVQRALTLPQDCSHLVNVEIQKWVLREAGLPDTLANESFRHAPDLIEDSSSSTDSSRENTLTKALPLGFSSTSSAAPDVTMAGPSAFE